MSKNRRSRKTANLTVVSTESAHIGTPKDELLVALSQFRVDCADPARLEKPSLRTVTRISEDLTPVYGQPDDPPCQLYALSSTAISEILSGKRQGLPSFDWVASYVLSCQRFAVGERPGRRDQGTTILRHWANIYAAHVAAAGGNTPAIEDALADRTAAYRLPKHQRDFILKHGPYGQVLLDRAQRGHPHARYRAAVLLASDPALTAEAVGLLIDVASTGHPLALDLLDTSVSPRAAALCAWDLASTAWASGADSQAYAFCRAAARGGIPEAVLSLAQVLLTDIDAEAVAWLARLGTEPATGRHHEGDRLPSPAGFRCRLADEAAPGRL